MTISAIGKGRRMRRILRKNGRSVVAALDDTLISGPLSGLEDVSAKIGAIAKARPDAALGFIGLFRQFGREFADLGQIVNLTASTTRADHVRKVQVTAVETAVAIDAAAVAVHVNTTAEGEQEMLQTLGRIVDECQPLGLPVLAIMYPRTRGDGRDENYESLRESDPRRYADLVAHAARIGADLGADIIKTQFTGDVSSFRRVIAACAPVPVLVAGGPVSDLEQLADRTSQALSAGAAGISYGRNIFARPDAEAILSRLSSIVHAFERSPISLTDMEMTE